MGNQELFWKAFRLLMSAVLSIPLLGFVILATAIYRVIAASGGGGRATYRQVYIASYTVYTVFCMCVAAVLLFAVNYTL